MPVVHDTVIRKIRESIGSSKVWISIDETSNKVGRSVANVAVGKLDKVSFGRSYLLMCEVFERTNAAEISQLFVKSLEPLRTDSVLYENPLVFETDAARYMRKAGAGLKVSFPQLIRVTYVAHGLHRVSEQVRSRFPKVDQLMLSMEMVLLKSPSRISLFKAEVDLPLPPKPIVTRWATWLKAVEYYAEDFQRLKSFVCDNLHGWMQLLFVYKLSIYPSMLLYRLDFLQSHRTLPGFRTPSQLSKRTGCP
ncbi:uncharacterized protein LOC108863672 [Galendromus occidentalis]|uniref:Uncharacterized protein LOC108863672 n=1 Tax=Galendromus occidentalis TaxID=34638 RepID=A0AAJ7L4L3_9ACAR|nr:uncharacterized protein LOC108863672 [Galendromus occidentalis]